tara:strand:+ start:59 stop:505 length:447 start_codon:yes stop_codon:yes gene_type:complete
LFAPFGKLQVVVVGPVKDNHTVGCQPEILQEIFVVLFSFADFHKLGRVAVGIDHHVHFEPAFLLPFLFRVPSYAFHDIGKQPDGTGIEDEKFGKGNPVNPADRQKWPEMFQKHKIEVLEKLVVPASKTITCRTLDRGLFHPQMVHLAR